MRGDSNEASIGRSFGDYQIRGLLGSGGMGEVFEAFDVRSSRTVALKLLRQEMMSSPSYRERFERESRIAARLTEPHVIPIHSFGEIGGVLYLDMRMVQGMDLGRILGTHGALAPGRAVAIVAQIASALDAAHADGLVHRDVKPENVLVTPTDFAYLVDFGIAHSGDATRLTETGSTIGSFAYMAPERFDDASPAPSADIYALTCVLYECLTGSKPFPQRTVQGLIAAHSASPPPHLPAALSTFDAVIARGMAKDPAQRFRTCAELVDAANHALVGVGQWTAPTLVAHTPAQDSRRFAPTVVRAQPRRSRRGVWLAACAALVLTLAGVAGFLALSPGSEQPLDPTPAAGPTAPADNVDVAEPTSAAA